MSYVKTEEEVALIKEGGRLMGEIVEKLIRLVKPGVSAWEIDQEAEQLIKQVGGRPAFKGYQPRGMGTPFPTTICACLNEEVVHGIATMEKVMKAGDIFSIDIGMEWPNESQKFEGGGYYTDTAVTLAVGEVSEETKKLLLVTQKALAVGIEQCRSGNTIADIGRAIQKYVTPQGYGIVRDLVGHGVGHQPHEEPPVPNYYVKALARWELKPGVVIAIEPMITLGHHAVVTEADHWTIRTKDRSLSAHFEHTIIITEGEPVVATRRPHES